MIPRAQAICFICHYYEAGTDPDNDINVPRCKAFPSGIPDEILNGGFDHRKPLGNEAITFKLAQDKTQADLEEWEAGSLELEKREIKTKISGFTDPPA